MRKSSSLYILIVSVHALIKISSVVSQINKICCSLNRRYSCGPVLYGMRPICGLLMRESYLASSR
uniref:Hflx-type G domain-containing protein n=1 Tax=Parascaris univalens TaxID=6257 RepID=A0A915CAN6_PARUN